MGRRRRRRTAEDDADTSRDEVDDGEHRISDASKYACANTPTRQQLLALSTHVQSIASQYAPTIHDMIKLPRERSAFT